MRRRSQVVRQRSAKPLFAGSIPAVASILPAPPAFSFPATVQSHGWYLLAPFRWSSDQEVLRRPEKIGSRVFELEIQRHPDGLEIRGAPMSVDLERRMRRMFQLDVDVSGFLEMSSDSPMHHWVVSAGFGRLLCGSTVWEDAVKIIATTNTTWRQTMRMIELLVAKCGKKGAFPDPADVLRFSEEELQRDCRLGYRARSIHALASGLQSGEITLPAVSAEDPSTDILYREYLKLPGIGPYGAAHLLAMDGRHDFIAVDSEFRRFVSETHHRGRRVSDKAMLRRYAKWGRWKYLAYWSELWKSVADRLHPEQNAGN